MGHCVHSFHQCSDVANYFATVNRCTSIAYAPIEFESDAPVLQPITLALRLTIMVAEKGLSMVCKTKAAKRRTKKRGVSIAIYHRVERMIKAGLLKSWKEAEKEGYVLPPAQRGRKRKPVPKIEARKPS